MNSTATNLQPHLASLEVLGVGISIEMLRQTELWEAIRRNPNTSALPTDLSVYPAKYAEKKEVMEKASLDALMSSTKNFVTAWPIPCVSVWPTKRDPNSAESPSANKTEANHLLNWISYIKDSAGLPLHKLAPQGAYCQDNPEDVLERAFQFFEGHPEVPALLFMAQDGDVARSMIGDNDREDYWEDGPRRFDSMSETAVALILAKRERVNALRPFMPSPETALYAAGKTPDGFRATKYLPEPWTFDQLREFDRMPTLAILHRPIRVSYRKEKKQGSASNSIQPVELMHDQERPIAFKNAFDKALAYNPEQKPEHIFFDTGGPATGRHVVPLTVTLQSSLPGFDLFEPHQGYDIHTHFGNTGAASPFVQWALACIATALTKTTSIAVNLRQREEATITSVTPKVNVRDSATQVKDNPRHMPNSMPPHLCPGQRESIGSHGKARYPLTKWRKLPAEWDLALRPLRCRVWEHTFHSCRKGITENRGSAQFDGMAKNTQ